MKNSTALFGKNAFNSPYSWAASVLLWERTIVGRPRCLMTMAHVIKHLGHRHRLTRSGDAEQRLVAVAAGEPRGQLRDRARLVSRRLVGGDEFESHEEKVNRAKARCGRPNRAGKCR